MLESPVISVIVAVYQAEKYIHRCLDSIRAQSFSDFEAILVDDGSSDESGIICDEYAKSDFRFRVIHKKHEGVSAARQTGLDASNGEYIIHADPDDWVEPTWLQDLLRKIKEDEADIVICDYERIFNNRTVYCCQKPRSLKNNDILIDLLEDKVWGCSWNKLVKKSFLDESKASFNADMSIWEDLYVMCHLVSHGAKVTYLPEVLYHYDAVTNTNSLVRSLSAENKIRSMMTFIDDLSPVLVSHIFDEGWYRRKSKVKGLLFRSNNRPNRAIRIRNTYPEINHRYIEESRNCRLGSLEYCVGLCLAGHSFLAHTTWSFQTFVRAFISASSSFARKVFSV